MNRALPTDPDQPQQDGIETERFRLRPIAPGDQALYQDVYCDPDTMRYVGPPLSIAQAARSFHAAVKQTATPQSKTRFLVVVDKRSGVGVGICGVCFGVPGWGSAEIGMILINSARSQGFSNEVLAGVIDLVFATSDALQVWVRYAAEHAAAERLVRSLDFSLGAEPPPDGDSRQSARVRRDVWQA